MSDIAILDPVNQVVLDWYADNDVVHVTPRNMKRFEIQKDQAIAVLQLAHEGVRFHRQFALLLDRLAEWIKDRQDKIADAIVTLQDNSLAFVIVRREAKYDEQLQDDLAHFDLAISNDPNLDLINLKTLALPHVTGDSLLSFVDERLRLSYKWRANQITSG